MNLSIVIVNWNSREHLRACLASIAASVRRVSYETIVIDAASFDGCGEMLAEQYPQVRFIQADTNLGFARANNRAAEDAVGDYLLFLNPDTEVLGAAIDVMYEALTTLPEAGVVGCRLLNADRSLQSSCVQSFPTIANQALDSEFLRKRWPKSSLWGMAALFEGGARPREVQGISGACLMIRRATFEHVGRFSDDYFMYAEDIDLAYKVQRAGHRNYYVPGATVVHFGGQSSQQAANVFAAVMIPEAIRRFLRKTRGSAYSIMYQGMMLVAATARLSLLGLAWVGGSRGPSSLASCRKWLAILRWSVGRNGLVARYYPERG